MLHYTLPTDAPSQPPRPFQLKLPRSSFLPVDFAPARRMINLRHHFIIIGRQLIIAVQQFITFPAFVLSAPCSQLLKSAAIAGERRRARLVSWV